jgi:hypothetical protein
MAVTIAREGFGYVEPNHLSAPRNGQVYAQLPAAEDIEVLENGMFVKYDYAAGECNFDGEGPWMMVFNEEKLYDERHQMHRDYAMQKSDFYDGVMTPRVFAMVPGDIFTTNAVKEAEYTVGDKLKVGADGRLEAGAAPAGEHSFKVVKETTMPDLQPGVKIQVIA